MEASRRATPDDRDRIVELARQAVAELSVQRGGEVWRRRDARIEPLSDDLSRAIDESTADGGRLVVVGTIDEVVIGYGVVHRDPITEGGSLAVIDDLYVEPGARGVGVGEAMMDRIVEWAEGHGCIGLDAVALPGNRETKNFFESFGLVARAIVVHRSLLKPTVADDTIDLDA
jgi:GNAT superfamily N-acetyltransferase